MPSRHPRRTRAGRTAGATAAAALLLLSACSSAPAPTQRVAVDDGTTSVEPGITYSQAGDQDLKLDACLPSGEATSRPALIVVHGGGFTSGDRVEGGSRGLCETAAGDGVVGFSIDYRLAPASHYPAQVDDVSAAVSWLREPAQVARFGIDPARIGVLGSSAGAVLALSVGTAGEGNLGTGTRVKSVISLSGVADFRPSTQLGTPRPQAVQLALAYLGCTSVTQCPDAAAASPVTRVDPTDAPVLLVNGTDELIPRQQADAMAAALQSAGVEHREMFVDGDLHGTSLLTPEVRTAVRAFLKETL